MKSMTQCKRIVNTAQSHFMVILMTKYGTPKYGGLTIGCGECMLIYCK
jgi:hypothetical protein